MKHGTAAQQNEREDIMKTKIVLSAFLCVIIGMTWTPAIAKKKSGNLPAPKNLTATLHPDSICFAWDPVDGAVKYSLDIDVDVDANGDGVTDEVVEFSFGTGDRTDEGVPSDPNFCVLLEDLRSDLNDDGIEERVSGAARVKVKALNPGKGNGRQNNAFSDEVSASMTPLEAQFCDPVFPWCNAN